MREIRWLWDTFRLGVSAVTAKPEKKRKPREVKPKVRRPGQPLTIGLVADALNCSPDHVRNLIAAGHLPAVRVPGAGMRRKTGFWLILSKDLDRAIESWKVAQ